MILEKDKFINDDNYQLATKLNFSDEKIDDALIKEISDVDIELKITKLDEDEFLAELKYKPQVKYLDARSLKELDLTFDFENDILFTSDLEKAEELEMEYFTDNINIGQLVFELTVVNLPLNYSEEAAGKFYEETEDIQMTNPFAEAFKNEKEEK